jgi:predicted amidohydrolase YtcJ
MIRFITLLTITLLLTISCSGGSDADPAQVATLAPTATVLQSTPTPTPEIVVNEVPVKNIVVVTDTLTPTQVPTQESALSAVIECSSMGMTGNPISCSFSYDGELKSNEWTGSFSTDGSYQKQGDQFFEWTYNEPGIVSLVLVACGPSECKEVKHTIEIVGSEGSQSGTEEVPFSNEISLLAPTALPTSTQVQQPNSESQSLLREAGPEVVFHNGVVVTMVNDRPLEQALAIQEGTILAVGSNEEILALRGKNTNVVDLNGRALLPGFVDPHTHLLNERMFWNMTLEEAQDLALRGGITTIGNPFANQAILSELQGLENRGSLRVRTNLYLAYNDNCGQVFGHWYQGQPPIIEHDRMLRIPGVKIFSDGGTCGLRPAMSFDLPKDYVLVGRKGDAFLTQEELVTILVEVHDAGYQPAIHAIGDRAIELVQDAIDEAFAGIPVRVRMEHNLYIRPDLRQRYSELNIIPVMFGQIGTCWIDKVQGGVSTMGELVHPEEGLTTEGRTWVNPIGTLLREFPTLPIAWKSDSPYLSVRPLDHLYSLVTQRELAGDDYVWALQGLAKGTVCQPPWWLENETITVEQALPLMTINGAHALGMEEWIGSLEAGKFADLIILSESPLETDPDSLPNLNVLVTMVNGNVEYCAQEHEALCP